MVLIHFVSTPKNTTERQEKTFNALLQAIKICLLENKCIRSTAREHSIDKSSLQRHVKIENIAALKEKAAAKKSPPKKTTT